MPCTLLLVPTPFERRFLSESFVSKATAAEVRIEICGFGPIVSGIRTANLIRDTRPERVVLIGIAGALHPELAIGQAKEFYEAVCYGVGAGTGSEFVTAQKLGWQQWQSDNPDEDLSDGIRFGDMSDRAASGSSGRSQLLTCCAASACEEDVRHRREAFPDAMAEDMEGYSVAVACHFAAIPLRLYRGISNRAGDRDKSRWRVREAMESIEQIVLEAL
jgi:futalosine hydrolase